MKQKALRAEEAHSHEDEECRKRLRSARECALAHSFSKIISFFALFSSFIHRKKEQVSRPFHR